MSIYHKLIFRNFHLNYNKSTLLHKNNNFHYFQCHNIYNFHQIPNNILLCKMDCDSNWLLYLKFYNKYKVKNAYFSIVYVDFAVVVMIL